MYIALFNNTGILLSTVCTDSSFIVLLCAAATDAQLIGNVAINNHIPI